MAVNLYRRHRKECEAGHAEDDVSGRFEEGRRGWRKCGCLIHCSGTLGGKFKRKSTGKADWDEADTVIAEWEKTDSWDGKAVQPVPAVVAPPIPSVPGRITIMEATEVFLRNREATQLAQPTLRKYRTFTKRILNFAESRGYVMLDQFSSGDIDVFYATWDLSARTKGKRLTTLRSFFRFCVNRKWLPESPVSSDIKPPKGANRVANKAPFTDEELQRIIDACDRLPEVTWGNGSARGVWTGNDVKDFIWVLVYTGLRISDVALFNMSRLRGNEVFLRAKKNGGDVFAYIPTWLCDRLNSRTERYGARPFLVGNSDRLETVTDVWRSRISKVCHLAGKFEEPPTPHRFRHTFARILLQRGVPVADVADLLGDDEKTVRDHYARWVPERQARLTRILQDAFDDKPRPKLTGLKGGRH